MELSSDQATAKLHIEEISKRKKQFADDGKGGVAADLQGALQILSKQLYNKSTHFLLELIQNADDNSYEVATPTLNLTYKNGQLRVDCNEIGFMPKNVDAICGVGSSSKADLDLAGQYIGHKGIGFKSVFKVADIVYISSRSYSFHFDKTTGPIGMITPIWGSFPENILLGHTSYLLRLSNDSIHFKKEQLIKALRSTDSKVLIFLRNLKELNLRILLDTEQYWEITLKRSNGLKDKFPIVILQENDKLVEYVVSKYAVEIPVEDGTGHRNSEIILAFPLTVSDSQTELLEAETQKVYAFLPVRDYGFKFLLQADFALTASREDLDECHPRNSFLRNATQDAFIKAIEELGSSILRYSWLRYLPRARPPGLLQSLGFNIECRLLRLPVLESCAGQMSRPISLKYIPQRFLDNTGVPFTLCSHTSTKYLSSSYPTDYVEELKAIGVMELSLDSFLEDLGWFTENSHVEFQQKDPDWHAQLAQALLPDLGTSSFRNTLITLKIIPLRDGEWVSAEGNTIFFSENNSQSIPDGVQVQVLDPAAEMDLNRQTLYSGLGVKQYDTSTVCRLIMDLHQDFTKASLLSLSQLKSHVQFLYCSNHIPSEDAELWFATNLDGKCQGSELYVDTGIESVSAAANFFNVDDEFPFLHRDYLLLFPDRKEDWILWLHKKFGLSTIPRLVTFPRKHEFGLSDDFRYLFRSQPSAKVLLLLRDNWKYYSTWIEVGSQESSLEQSRELVRNQLASTSVMCLNGRTQPLEKTSLPNLDADFSVGSRLAVLDIPDPGDQRWHVLGCLGVAVKKDFHFYLLCLENMQSLEIPIDDVRHLYEEIQNRCTDNETRLKIFADENPIVYLPPSHDNDSPRWIKHQDCIWRERIDDDIQAAGYVLEKLYPNCKELFCSVLGVYDNEIQLLLKETRNINNSTNLDDIAKLLTRINHGLEGAAGRRSSLSKELVQDLTSANIFPVRMQATGSQFDHVVSAKDERDWFIADHPDFLDGFRGRILLLAFESEQVSQLDTLFNDLRLDRRRLSRVTTGKPGPRGESWQNEDYTKDFRQKAGFITRLASRRNFPPDAKQRVQSLYLQLRLITVYQATSIRQKWSITSNGSQIDSRERRVRVALTDKDGWLYLFMTKEDMSSHLAPLELITQVSFFFDIKGSNNISVLTHVLSRVSVEDLQDLFRKQGIPDIKEFREIQEPKGIQRRAPRYVADLEPETLGEDSSTSQQQPNLTGFAAGISQNPWKNIVTDEEDSGMDEPMPGRYKFPAEFSKLSISRMKASDNILVRGELITSDFFQRQIGKGYAPEKHWTSPLRSQVGYPQYTGPNNDAAFTFATCRKRVTDILIRKGHRSAENWREKPPVYHVDVATTAGKPNSSFPLSVEQLERARKYAVQSASTPKHVSILVKISKIQSNIDFRFYVDPWQLYLAESLRLEPGTVLMATMGDSSPKLSQPPQVRHRSLLRNVFGLHEDVEIGDAAKELNLSRSVRRGHTKRLEQFTYKKIRGPNQIRLLILLPGESGTVLQGIIRHISLENPEPYQALSYRWGNPTGDHVLRTHEGLIPLYSSLHSALQRLRDPREERILWVDAICINQENRREKEKQIPMMAKIYNNATFVIAYLGMDADESNLALQTLQQIKIKDADPEMWPPDLPPIPQSWKEESIPPANDPAWGSLGALFARSWFSRVWIIQEVVVADTVMVVCGDWILDWDELHDAVQIARREIISAGEEYQPFHSIFDVFTTLASARRQRHDESFDWAVYNLLEKFRYADATEEPDRMFALLNLAADKDTQPQLFEKNDELPFEKIVLRYATAFVRQDRTLPMIYSAGLSSTRDNKLFPSWTPDWTPGRKGMLIDAMKRGVPPAPEINIPLRSSVREDAEDELVLSGVFLMDKIIYVSKAANTPDMLPQYLNEVADEIDRRISVYFTGERRSELKWKIPIADATVPIVVGFNPLDLSASYLALMRLLKEGISPYSQQEMSEISREMGCSQPQNAWAIAQDYLSALHGNFSGWRFVVTDRGYVGIAPNLTEPGDIVSLLGGSKVAFLIRKSGSRQGAYRLVGGCYIHGIKLDNSVEVEEREVRIY